MHDFVCIFGSNGKIGSIFKNLYPHATTFKYGLDYTSENIISTDCVDFLKSRCKLLILCHHNLKEPLSYLKLTCNILDTYPDLPGNNVINIASDAELIPIPTRYLYGNVKRLLRKRLEDRNGRAINIFCPYIHQHNNKYITRFIFGAFREGWSKDYYYFSPLSKVVKPWRVQNKSIFLKGAGFTNEYVANYILQTSGKKLSKAFHHEILANKKLYMNICSIMEKNLHIDVIHNPSLFFGYVGWVLNFKGECKEGTMHKDMKRCYFGSMFRCILCVKDTSDFTIEIDGEILKPSQGDILVIPDSVDHKPLKMSYGERIICVFDVFTSEYINIVSVVLFLIFNNIKSLGVNV